MVIMVKRSQFQCLSSLAAAPTTVGSQPLAAATVDVDE